jgi:hypothetical protein
MKTSHLHDVWSSPDNSRLVSKQFSFRLPVHIAAKIAALGEMYPQKNRTQIVADLLSAALDNLEENLPMVKGPAPDREMEDLERRIADQEGYAYEPFFLVEGPRSRYRALANKHYKELEKELGNEKPENLFNVLWMDESKFPK